MALGSERKKKRKFYFLTQLQLLHNNHLHLRLLLHHLEIEKKFVRITYNEIRIFCHALTYSFAHGYTVL